MTDQVSLISQTGKLKWSSATLNPVEWHNDHSIFDSIHPSDRERVESAFAKCLIKQQWVEYTTRVVVEGSGQIVHVRAFLWPLSLADVAVVAVWHTIPDNYLDFTNGDIEMLSHFGSGMLVREVAEKMDRSESTIDARLRSLKEKLGAKSLHGLVACAIRSGLIHSLLVVAML